MIPPEGEGIRRALKWISEMRTEHPSLTLKELIDQASRKFDLSPLEDEGLFTWIATSRGGSERPS